MFNKYDVMRLVLLVIGVMLVISDIGTLPVQPNQAAIVDYTSGK
jgi:hypothetical protein